MDSLNSSNVPSSAKVGARVNIKVGVKVGVKVGAKVGAKVVSEVFLKNSGVRRMPWIWFSGFLMVLL